MYIAILLVVPPPLLRLHRNKFEYFFLIYNSYTEQTYYNY